MGFSKSEDREASLDGTFSSKRTRGTDQEEPSGLVPVGAGV